MKYLGYGLFLFLGILLQTAGSPGLLFFGFKPEIMLLLALLFGMIQPPWSGALFGFFSGLIYDLLTGRFIGLYAVTLMLAAISVGFVTKRLYKENVVVRFLAVFGGSIFGQLLYLIGIMAFGHSFPWSWLTISTVLGTSLVNAGLSLVLFRPLIALHKRLIYLDELYKRTG